MKASKYLRVWLVIILLLAIGIGTYGALSNNSTGNDAGTPQAEEEEGEVVSSGSGSESSYFLSEQRKKDIEMDTLREMIGEYQAVESGDPGEDTYVAGYWHLSIVENIDGKGPYLTVYDNSAGQPGFEGRIMYLHNGVIIVEPDKSQFREMPVDWDLDNGYAVMGIEKSNKGVNINNRETTIYFISVDE